MYAYKCNNKITLTSTNYNNQINNNNLMVIPTLCWDIPKENYQFLFLSNYIRIMGSKFGIFVRDILIS